MSSLPAGWTLEPFASVATYNAGRTPPRSNQAYWNGATGTPWVSIADMEPYGLITRTKETITESALADVFRGKVVPAGTLLMSFKLTIGRVATLGISACHNEAIISIIPRADVDQRYLAYYLSQVDYSDLQDRQVKGQTLNQDKINRIPIVLPPPAERSKIADVLDHVRAGICLERQAEHLALELKSAAMRELFTRGLRGEPQKETEIGPVPESWEVVALGACVQRPDYGFTASAQQSKIGPKFLRITDVQDGTVDWETVPYCVIDKKTLEQKRLGDGDIVVARIGATTGKAFYIENAPEAVFASYMIRLRALPEKLLPKFLYYFMQSDAYWSHIEQNKGGRLKGGINIPVLSSLPVGRPKDIDEQREIVSILDAIDRKIDLHRRKRAVLEELFKSLLHKLMTGEVRVWDLDLSVLGSAQMPDAESQLDRGKENGYE